MTKTSALQIPKSGDGWYPDPFTAGEKERYFQGNNWTNRVREHAQKPAEDTSSAQGFTTPKANEGFKAPKNQPTPKNTPFKKPEKKQQQDTPLKKPQRVTPPAPQGTPFQKPQRTQKPTENTTPTQGFTTPSKPATEATNPFSAPTQAEPTPKPAAPSFSKPAGTSPFSQKVEKEPPTPPTEDLSNPWEVFTPDTDESSLDTGQDTSFFNTPTPEAKYETWDDEEPTTSSKDSILNKLGNLNISQRTATWAVTGVVSALSLAAAFLLPAPTTSFNQACAPIAPVISTNTTTLTDEDRRVLAAALAEQELNEELTTLAHQAEATTDSTALKAYCKPTQ